MKTTNACWMVSLTVSRVLTMTIRKWLSWIQSYTAFLLGWRERRRSFAMVCISCLSQGSPTLCNGYGTLWRHYGWRECYVYGQHRFRAQPHVRRILSSHNASSRSWWRKMVSQRHQWPSSAPCQLRLGFPHQYWWSLIQPPLLRFVWRHRKARDYSGPTLDAMVCCWYFLQSLGRCPTSPMGKWWEEVHETQASPPYTTDTLHTVMSNRISPKCWSSSFTGMSALSYSWRGIGIGQRLGKLDMGAQPKPRFIEGAPVPILGCMISCLAGLATYDDDFTEHSKLILPPETYDSTLHTAIYAAPAHSTPITTSWMTHALAPTCEFLTLSNASTNLSTTKSNLFQCTCLILLARNSNQLRFLNYLLYHWTPQLTPNSSQQCDWL